MSCNWMSAQMVTEGNVNKSSGLSKHRESLWSIDENGKVKDKKRMLQTI